MSDACDDEPILRVRPRSRAPLEPGSHQDIRQKELRSRAASDNKFALRRRFVYGAVVKATYGVSGVCRVVHFADDLATRKANATESEDAANGAGGPPVPESLPPHSTEDRKGIRSVVENRPLPEAEAAGDVSAAEVVSMTHSSVPVVTPNKEPEDWSVDEARFSGAVAKRAREEGVVEGLNTSAARPEEPPPKAALVRRMSFKPKPNISTEQRSSATSPP
ncbi:hypothetical protein HPB47_018990 [Ixodes persulcatus]|uniref:Uncharacterized protein n=1 Tax=Ixodes persulcatus TaxID=34615 RepID=A0AC60R2V6_IXOPE|nr:hypothetical protein HPB47_018990 [Ixodes persulcatus]